LLHDLLSELLSLNFAPLITCQILSKKSLCHHAKQYHIKKSLSHQGK